MIKKSAVLSFLLLLALPSFSQEVIDNKPVEKVEIKLSYLDSIKKTFVKDEMASCVDSLWMKELTNLDLYKNLSEDIKTINIDEKVDYELSTDLLKQRLMAMDAKSPFKIEYNEGLENIIKSFLKYRKKSFERLMAISEYYFPLFEEALANKKVPLEIKYLAIVESALNPKAVSKMGATGLWQFMYQTGKQYGLKIDSYVDERSDPLRASEAAAQYMTNMYTIFGDWSLVLASYNSGPGNVSKAIRRSGGQQSYWSIRKYLPKETQAYVPAFLATMYIYEYHTAHGIVPQRASVKHFDTDTIRIKQQMTFKQIADLLDVPVSQLQLLNPSYKLNVVPFYQDESHYLRLPQEKAAVFASNEDKIYAYTTHELDAPEKQFQFARAIVRDTTNYTIQRITLPKIKYYRVRKGDNLSEIAAKYDVAVSDLKKWNKIKKNTVSYGRNLKIISTESVVRSIRKQTITTAPNRKNELADVKLNKAEQTKHPIKTDTSAVSTNEIYVVQKGDNLNSIAKKQGITLAEIKEWNPLLSSKLALGTTLIVAKKQLETITTTAEDTKPIHYVVAKGDNLGTLATKFEVSIEEIKKWNNLVDSALAIGANLIVGKQKIAEPVDKVISNSIKSKNNSLVVTKKSALEYQVKKGDSLFSIAKKYPGVTIADLKKWNDIRGEGIKPGMKLKING